LVLGYLNAGNVCIVAIDFVGFRLLVPMIALVEHVNAEGVHLIVHGYQIDSLGLGIVVEEAEGHEATFYIVESNVNF
jgi:hypothetical protein